MGVFQKINLVSIKFVFICIMLKVNSISLTRFCRDVAQNAISPIFSKDLKKKTDFTETIWTNALINSVKCNNFVLILYVFT